MCGGEGGGVSFCILVFPLPLSLFSPASSHRSLNLGQSLILNEFRLNWSLLPLSICPALFPSSSQHTTINNAHPTTVNSLLDLPTPSWILIGCCLALTSWQLSEDWLKLTPDFGIGGAPRGGVLCFCGSVAVALRKICVHAVIPTVTHSSLHFMPLH